LNRIAKRILPRKTSKKTHIGISGK
jgi:hypothetical protein